MEFSLVADARLGESKILFDQGKYHASIYLVGYVLEIKLKELQYKKYGNFTQIHGLREFFQKNGINSTFYKSEKWESLFVDAWDVEMRYREDDFLDFGEEDIQKIYFGACRLIGKIKRKLV